MFNQTPADAQHVTTVEAVADTVADKLMRTNDHLVAMGMPAEAAVVRTEAARLRQALEPFDLDSIPVGTIDPADRWRKPRDKDRTQREMPAPSMEDVAAHVTRFVDETVDELLTTTMIEGDPDASFAARQRLLERAEPKRVTRVIRTPAGLRRDPRDLLYRIGADPVRGHGMVRCPSHDDRAASLSWRVTDDDRVLLHCFAGCTFNEIREAVR